MSKGNSRGVDMRKRFVVDSMLGHLARWLRILGYDTIYSRNFSDWQLLRIARSSGRILVTRDKGLHWRARKQGIRSVLIESTHNVERLAELASKVGLELALDPRQSRCPLCNGDLKEASRNAVKGRVPERTLEYVDEFYVCTRCGKIYWEGSHWSNMRRMLQDAAKLKSSREFDI